MTDSETAVPPVYENQFLQQTLDLLEGWAGEPGGLLKQSLSTLSEDDAFSLARQYLRSETIFLADRDAERDNALDRKHVCEGLAADHFSLDQVFKHAGIESLERIFYEISALQTIHHNQSISMDYKVGAAFADQGGAARIHLIKFFIIKAICCIIDGKELNFENQSHSLVDHKDIRLKHLELEISNLLREAFAICVDDQSQMRGFQERIMTRALQAEEAVILPTEAPALYAERPDKSVRAEDFIRTVYEPWLGKGLLRPHIKELDKSLYNALYKQGVPKDFDELLPKAPGQSAKRKGVMADLEAIEKRRASSRQASKKNYVGVRKL